MAKHPVFIIDIFLFTTKFLPSKDIPAVSIVSSPSKLPAVRCLSIQLAEIVLSQATSDMLWTKVLGFSPAFNFAGHPPFSVPFLAEMVSSFRFSDG